MSDRPARAALRGALGNGRRHLVAVALVVAAFAVTHYGVGTPTARYGAYLFAFCVWMGWFVLTAVDWIRRADF
ncbi:MAG: hypothetical protein ABEJ61_10585 [Haloferacaceae archaeon]